MAARETPIEWTPARRVRSFDHVSAQIREAIVSGRIAQGDRLPGERELCASFGVSRPTLREAMRALEAMGLVQIRPGKGGGAYAVAPSEAVLGDAVAALVHLQAATPGELAEFRVSFEGENAWWAARRATPDDVAALEALVAAARRASDDPSFAVIGGVDARFHEALARATQNRLRIGIALGIHDAMMRQVALLQPSAARWRRRIPRDLASVAAAVRAGDPAAAQEAMRAHVLWSMREIAAAGESALPAPRTAGPTKEER